MGSLFFSMKGRINGSIFQKGAFILIAIGAVLTLITYFVPGLTIILSLLSLVLIWPWLALWIKRFHDAGKSGWMSLLALIVWGLFSWVGSLVVNIIKPIDEDMVQEAMTSGNLAAIIEAFTLAARPQFFLALASSIIVSLLVVFLFNAIIKSDPEENQFGNPVN